MLPNGGAASGETGEAARQSLASRPVLGAAHATANPLAALAALAAPPTGGLALLAGYGSSSSDDEAPDEVITTWAVHALLLPTIT